MNLMKATVPSDTVSDAARRMKEASARASAGVKVVSFC